MKNDLTVPNSGPVSQPNYAAPLVPDDLSRRLAATSVAEPEGLPWGRYFRALWIQKFAILAVLVAGYFAAGYVRDSVPPTYSASAGIWVTNVRSSQDGGVGPVRSQGSMTALAWMQLIKLPNIMDSVVRKLSLNVAYQDPADSLLFESLTTSDPVVAGHYTLETDSAGTRFLLRSKDGTPLDSGAVGDSIGASIGLLWAPPSIPGASKVSFNVVSLRDASRGLGESLNAVLDQDGGLLLVQMSGSNPKRITQTVNQVADEFLRYAEFMSKANQVQVTGALAEQKRLAEEAYQQSLMDLEEFRLATLLTPTKGTPVQGGVDASQNLVLNNYMDRRTLFRELQHDITELDSVTKAVADGQSSPNAFLAIPSVGTKGEALTLAIAKYQTEASNLQTAANTFTPGSMVYDSKMRELDAIRREEILPYAQDLINQLRRERDRLAQRLRGDSAEMLAIPRIQITDLSLEAEMRLRQHTADMLTERHAVAQMSEASAIPDVRLQYRASQPNVANTEAADRIWAMILLASLGVAVFLALLLDRLDKKFRHPEQATGDLGLTILGVVPRIRQISTWQSDPVVAASVVEAFRTVRLALGNAFPNRTPIRVAISSPGVGEGKSIIASNLALSLSEGGYRTLLIDGDTRRGELHSTFAVERRPGLLDHLAGHAQLDDVLHKTQHDNLWMMPSGTRHRRGPELLMTPITKPMIEELSSRFDAIIIDTPPLSAGVDAYVLSTLAANLIMVLRVGKSDRKLAEAKLELMDRLPVRVIGAVLNGVQGQSSYQYYTYVDGYAAEVEEDASFLPGASSSNALTRKR